MAARGGGGGRRRRGAKAAGHGDDERWLLTYADMITLLMALFMVMFSISAVNISKYKSLQRSLQEAFSGRILSGGNSINESGSSQQSVQAAPQLPFPPLVSPPEEKESPPRKGEDGASRARKSEDDAFRALKRRIDAYAAKHGFRKQLQTRIVRKGLVVRLLTDRVLFDSGQAVLKTPSVPLLKGIGGLLRSEVRRRATVVEGHTDNVPIHGGLFPTNWELSTARATTVVRFLIRVGADPYHLSAAGFAATRPLASNRTESGRHRNRRVEIVVLRQGRGSGD